MASIGGATFENGLYWVTKWQGRVVGQAKAGLDGSQVITRLATQPDAQSGVHKFQFAWEPQSVVEALNDAANDNQIHTISIDGEGSYKCYFPDGQGSIDAKPIVSIDRNTSFSHADVKNQALDLYSGEFTVFILE